MTNKSPTTENKKLEKSERKTVSNLLYSFLNLFFRALFGSLVVFMFLFCI